LFFIPAFSLSWALWALAALLSVRSDTFLTQLLHYAGGLAPFAVTVALIHFKHSPDFRRDFWRRAIEFKRIGTKWCGVVLLTISV
jgi:hypothetical protein